VEGKRHPDLHLLSGYILECSIFATMKTKIILLTISVILTAFQIVAAEIPEGAVQLRDDPFYFQLVRGIRNAGRVMPTEKNIETLVSKREWVYQNYVRELYKGFIAEGRGDLLKATQHYKKCLSIPVHEEQSYYTNIDLARISLKLGKTADAINYLEEYLRYMDQEIKAGEGQYTDIFFGYVPSGKALAFMKEDYKRLSAILEALKQTTKK
jgi:tetratricopeptide (TPR) repeat protein